MSKFCTACGIRNEDEAGFCQKCGKALRAVAATAPSAASQAPTAAVSAAKPSSAPARGRWLLPTVLAGAVLVIAIGGIAWWASPPAASADAFASALRGPSGASAAPSADLLCLADLPYDSPQITLALYDSNRRRWMDTLVSAGLYTAGQPVAGLFQQLIQYTATPELGTWRRGARLCVAKSWSVSEVKDGTSSPEKRGQHALYRASVVWKADGVAPWLAQVPPGQWSPGVRLDGGSLTTESSQYFEVRDRRWVALTTADLSQIQREVLRTAPSGLNPTATKADGGGLFASLTKLFSSVGGSKIDGTYCNKSSDLVVSCYTFRSNGTVLISAAGTEFEMKYEVDGDEIKFVDRQGNVHLVITMLKDGSIQGMMGMILTKQK